MGKALDKILTNETQTYNLRYERKFVFEGFYLEDIIEQVVMTNRFGFREVFEERGVNNVYFDDQNYTFYKQNVSGDGLRKKYRLRWYGDSFSDIIKPTFEIKKKFGEVGDKISFKLKELQFNLNTTSSEEIRKSLIQPLQKEAPLLGKHLEMVMPTLYNSYNRRYFLSACGNYRITLDYRMKFYNPALKDFRKSEYLLENNTTILELKYNTQHDSESRELTQGIPVRLSKNSKYVSGIDFISL